MTTGTTGTSAAATTNAEAIETPRPQGGPPDPVPEQRPWLTDEDAQGWRTVYRGTGQPAPPGHGVNSSVVVDLTHEQRAWLDRASRAAGLLRHQLIAKLIDDARRADPAGRPG